MSRFQRPKGVPLLITREDAEAFMRGAFVDGVYSPVQMEFAVPICLYIFDRTRSKEEREEHKRLEKIIYLVDIATEFISPLTIAQKSELVVNLFKVEERITPVVVKREFMNIVKDQNNGR